MLNNRRADPLLFRLARISCSYLWRHINAWIVFVLVANDCFVNGYHVTTSFPLRVKNVELQSDRSVKSAALLQLLTGLNGIGENNDIHAVKNFSSHVSDTRAKTGIGYSHLWATIPSIIQLE